MFKYKKNKPYKKSNKKFIALLSFLTVLLLLFYLINIADQKLMGTVIYIAELEIKTNVNKSFDASLNDYVKENEIKAEDFFVSSNENIGTITANTILINDLCNKISVSISENLTNSKHGTIFVPAGSLSGVESFANLGPKLMFTIMPVGTATVDYETSFQSVGINQVHFQVYLDINTTVKIVNPLQEGEVCVNKKFALIDTIIKGDVPSNFYGTASQ